MPRHPHRPLAPSVPCVAFSLQSPLPALAPCYLHPPKHHPQGGSLFPKMQAGPPTHLLLILILKKFFFFSVLFTICFFPWLKIIGDETPAAWSPAWAQKEQWEQTRIPFSPPAKQARTDSLPQVAEATLNPRGPASWRFLSSACSASCASWVQKDILSRGLFDFYQPSSLIFLCPDNIWCI